MSSCCRREMHAAQIPWLAGDHQGDSPGVPSSSDANGPGLPRPVLGGRPSDLHRRCFSEMVSSVGQRRFLVDPAERAALAVPVDTSPAELTRRDLAVAPGYSASLASAHARLRDPKLVDQWRASPQSIGPQ